MDPRVKTGLENITAELSLVLGDEPVDKLRENDTMHIPDAEDEGIATSYDDCSGFCENMD